MDGDFYDGDISTQTGFYNSRYFGSNDQSDSYIDDGYSQQIFNDGAYPDQQLPTSQYHYDSDRIDSDIEEALYSSIHHQTVNSQELSFSRMNTKVLSDGDLNVNNVIHKIQDDQDDRYSDKSGDSVQFIEQTPKNGNNLFVVVNQRKSIKIEKSKQRKLKRLEERKNGFSQRLSSNSNLMTNGLFGALNSVNNNYEGGDDLDLSYGNGISLEGINLIDDMSKFYNEDNYDSDEEKRTVRKMSNNKRFWQVDEKDILSRFMSRSSNNYRSRFKECKLCFKPGHVCRDCPTRKKICYICGDSDHQSSWCRKKMCSVCFTSGHFSNQCKTQMNKFTCSICKITGHSENKCTFNWRKFLNITDPQSVPVNDTAILNSITVNNRISCYNCGMNGSHFGHECNSLTINRKRFEIPSPILNIKRKKQHNYNSSTPSSKRLKSSSSPYSSDLYSVQGTPTAKPIHQQQNCDFNRSDSTIELDSDDSVNYAINLLKQSTSCNYSPNGGGSGNKKSPKSGKSPKSPKYRPTKNNKQPQQSLNGGCRYRNDKQIKTPNSNSKKPNYNNSSNKQTPNRRKEPNKQMKKIKYQNLSNNNNNNKRANKKPTKKTKANATVLANQASTSTKKSKKKKKNKKNASNIPNNNNQSISKYWNNNLFN